MSPTLETWQGNDRKVAAPRFLATERRAFVTSLAMLMRPEIYPPMEMITGETFHVVARGVVIKDMKILCSGMVWGLDMISRIKS